MFLEAILPKIFPILFDKILQQSSIKFIIILEDYIMKNLREVNDDILKDWFIYRDEDISSLKSAEDKKHWIYFDEIA